MIDVFTGLLEKSELSTDSFEWIKTIKYEMDAQSILYAKASDSEINDHALISTAEKIESSIDTTTSSSRSVDKYR